MAGPIWWGVGTHTWQAPFAARFGAVYCAAGGGGGFVDTTGPGTNGRGAGGGGGGLSNVTVNLTSEAYYTISVGGGGGYGSPGGSSSFTGPGVGVFASGGGGGGDNFGGAGGAPGGSPGQADGSKKGGPGNGVGGASPGPGVGGPGNIIPGRPASVGGDGRVGISWDYHPPTAYISTNNSEITEGETTTILYGSTWVTSLTISGIGAAAAGPANAVTVSPSITTSYCISGSGPGGSVSGGCVTINVYPPPIITYFYLSDYNPLSGDEVTLYWGTTGANAVSRTSSNTNSGLGSATGMATSGSLTFTAGTGGVYNVVLTASNPPGRTETSSPLQYTVRDETPNAFGWDDKIDCAPPGSLQESNTIKINGFGPTEYPSSKLPIKSNYPVQVMVNGDGVWRDVEQI